MTNNDDPKEFSLEITRMRDIRQRIGIIEAGYHDYLELKGGRKYRPSYNILSANEPPQSAPRSFLASAMSGLIDVFTNYHETAYITTSQAIFLLTKKGRFSHPALTAIP